MYTSGLRSVWKGAKTVGKKVVVSGVGAALRALGGELSSGGLLRIRRRSNCVRGMRVVFGPPTARSSLRGLPFDIPGSCRRFLQLRRNKLVFGDPRKKNNLGLLAMSRVLRCQTVPKCRSCPTG